MGQDIGQGITRIPGVVRRLLREFDSRVPLPISQEVDRASGRRVRARPAGDFLGPFDVGGTYVSAPAWSAPVGFSVLILYTYLNVSLLGTVLDY